ncbi:MAG: hypothetical protein CMN30_06630 [Sandaracinus sp.]|nr:hypothetical protein [Sandaracinus sp.]
MSVRTGLDRLPETALASLRGKRVGLLAHPASVNSELVPALDVLREHGVTPAILFGPEHGYAATAQDMDGVEGGEVEGLRVVSLYGSSAADLQPRASDLAELDVVVVDLQDVGARYYTYVWTAAFMLRGAARAGVKVLALDRPNPLGGEVVEGRPQRAGYRSFVGVYDVAVRHGMTLGEILRMVVDLEKLPPESLEVVPLEGWQRSMYFDETGLPWVLPSPNMPTLDTALVYPGGCVLEGTTLSEGRGTTRPFEIFGAPHVDPRALAELPIEGATLRPLSFEPTVRKHAQTVCGGVQVHVTDRHAFRSYPAYLRLIAAMLAQAPAEVFPWRTDEYEYETSRPAIDLLTGGPEYRQRVNAGDDLEDYLAADAQGATEFLDRRRPWLLY